MCMRCISINLIVKDAGCLTHRIYGEEEEMSPTLTSPFLVLALSVDKEFFL